METMIEHADFEAPGPGSWELDADHQNAPRGRFMTDVFDRGFTEGFRSFMGDYGSPLECIQARHVNGWMYARAVPAGAPDKGGAPPPPFVLKVLSRVVPELRRRNRRAAEAYEQKRWLADADAWDAERGSWVQRVEDLLADPIESMTNDQLADHLERSIELTEGIVFRHFELLGPAAAIGNLMMGAADWGLPDRDVLALLRGSSPASAATRAPLAELATATKAAAGGDFPDGFENWTIGQLRSLSSEVASRADAYLSTWGVRVLEDDIEAQTVAENPDLLISLVRAAAADVAADAPDLEAQTAGLRERVPAAERPRFDELLAEARRCYSVLDDNSGILAWVVGALRRSLVYTGNRLASDGRLLSATDLFDLEPGELVEMVRAGTGPSAADVAARSEARRAVVSAPSHLGDPPSEPPDPSVFPPAMARVTRAMNVFLANKFTAKSNESMGGQLLIDGSPAAEGAGIGDATVTGRIVVAADVGDALARLQPGDILACGLTTPAWNTIFPLVSGIVTSHGGPLGHTAVMAREFGLPAVVGIGSIDPSWDGRTATVVARS